MLCQGYARNPFQHCAHLPVTVGLVRRRGRHDDATESRKQPWHPVEIVDAARVVHAATASQERLQGVENVLSAVNASRRPSIPSPDDQIAPRNLL